MKTLSIEYLDDGEGENTDGYTHLSMHRDIGEDMVVEYLNHFSTFLRGVGFSFEKVGVFVTKSDGEDIEHWSDY